MATTVMSQEEYSIWREIFDALSTAELELVEWLLDSASRHAVIARDHTGYVWNGDGATELAQISGIVQSFAGFRRRLEEPI